ncbi:hypothetical protein DMM02_23535 [Salmonella enterica subsp. enterica serovar Virchow]|nr:hypothetical protein [Salmonella enterica subsp. enterica serovar Virchow]
MVFSLSYDCIALMYIEYIAIKEQITQKIVTFICLNFILFLSFLVISSSGMESIFSNSSFIVFNLKYANAPNVKPDKTIITVYKYIIFILPYYIKIY